MTFFWWFLFIYFSLDATAKLWLYIKNFRDSGSVGYMIGAIIMGAAAVAMWFV